MVWKYAIISRGNLRWSGRHLAKSQMAFFVNEDSYMKSILAVLKKDRDMLFIFVVFAILILLGIGCVIFAVVQKNS